MTSEDAKTGTGAKKPPRKDLKWGTAALIVIAVSVPIAATVGGAVTSPATRGVPEGHIIHLEANTPSEHTSTLRELISVGPDGKWHLLTREHEPQSVDAGSRDWISMPTVSPDGTQVAFIDQKITLQEEEQSDFWELWVLPVDPKTQTSGAGRLVADLSKLKLDEVRGLTWNPDGKAIVLASKGNIYGFDAATGKQVTILDSSRWPIISNARWPAFDRSGMLYFLAHTQSGDGVVDLFAFSANTQQKIPLCGPAIVFDVSQDSSKKTYNNEIAYVPPGHRNQIVIQTASMVGGLTVKQETLKAKYGWSLFGGRHISALHWSPSGRYLGYSVTKPPGGEDELFYLDTTTGACYKLPYRSGQASWTWGP